MSRTGGLLRPWSVDLLGNALGSVFYALSRRYRTVALKNLGAVYGSEKTEREIRTLAKQVFRHFAREALQFFRMLSLTREQVDRTVDLQGAEHLDDALAEGKGCIAITAHYGNWEILARKLVICGYKLNVIARDSDDRGMTGIATRIRESGGYEVFDRDQPTIGVVRRLRDNEILGILPDQNDIDGIPSSLFGLPARTAPGAAVLALRTGAPIVPVFARRMPDGNYLAVVRPRIQFRPSADKHKDAVELTQLVNDAIEREVRSNPSQWLWFHDRWKL